MIALLIAVLMVVLPLLHFGVQQGAANAAARRPHPRCSTRAGVGVGVIGLPMGFIPHVFFPDQTAEPIGWADRSPFQFEVGLYDGAWGVLGFLASGSAALFWLATGLGWSFFMLGAAYGHIRETVIRGDYAPYNFFTMFSDGFIGIWILVLLTLLAPGRLPE